MTTLFARIKSHFSNWRAWELNPVVVKELRQSVRSWAVIGMLLLFLAVMFCTALGFLVNQSFRVNEEQQLGGEVFSVFVVILTGASLLFIPLYVGVRLAAERQESNLDLLYVTTLTPERIIRGKFLCGAYMAVLFFSACMPFMVFTNLMRGVDLPTVFFILLCLFLVICAVIEAAIFLACLPISKLFKILLALVCIMFSFGLIRLLAMAFSSMMMSGVGSMMGTRDFWNGFLSGTGVMLAASLLLHFISVALISPPSANRALPLRIYLTAMWILGAALCYYWAVRERDIRFMVPWAVISFIVLTGAMLVVISNSDRLSLRVRRAIPANPAKRALAFLFYNGAAGGLVWLGFLVAVTFTVTARLLDYHGSVSAGGGFSALTDVERYKFKVVGGAALLYVFAYGLAALLIHRKLLGRRPPKLAGIFAILLPCAWALVPNIASFFLNKLNWTSLERNQLGNIFNLFVVRDDWQRKAHLVCAGAAVLLLLILNARWFARQFKEFQPLHRSTPPPILDAPSAPVSAVK
jgi:hypothetical protein